MKISKLNLLSKLLSMAANICVIVGIIIAGLSLYMTKESEKRQNAINAISTTRSSEFLKAYARVKTAYNSRKTEDAASLIDDLNYVMNVYDNIALLYINNLADRCTIKNSTYPAIKEVQSIADAMSYPKEYRKNIDRTSVLMEKENCE